MPPVTFGCNLQTYILNAIEREYSMPIFRRATAWQPQESQTRVQLGRAML